MNSVSILFKEDPIEKVKLETSKFTWFPDSTNQLTYDKTIQHWVVEMPDGIKKVHPTEFSLSHFKFDNGRRV